MDGSKRSGTTPYLPCFPRQAIEDGTLDEMEEITKSQKKRAKRKEEAKDDTPKPKKKRGRPPVEKPTPNPPRTTKMMKKLYNLVVNYKDRSVGDAEVFMFLMNTLIQTLNVCFANRIYTLFSFICIQVRHHHIAKHDEICMSVA